MSSRCRMRVRMPPNRRPATGPVGDAQSSPVQRQVRAFGAGFPLSSLAAQARSGLAGGGKKHKRVRRENVSCRNTGLHGNPRLTGDQAVAVIEAADREAIRMGTRARLLLLEGIALAAAGRPVDANLATIAREELGVDFTTEAGRRLARQQAARFERVVATLNSGYLRYTCRSPGCDGDEFAFVFPANRVMRLCAMFWNTTEPGMTIAQNQAATILHETFHIHFDMDHANRLRTANADCLESFALRLDGQVAPNTCVGF